MNEPPYIMLSTIHLSTLNLFTNDYSNVSTIITSTTRSSFMEEKYKWLADAPLPQEKASYYVTYCNGTGHLEYMSNPQIDFFELSTLLEPYHVREIRQITKIIQGRIYNYFKLFEGVPMKRNVVVKMNNEWITFCLNYSGLDWDVPE